MRTTTNALAIALALTGALLALDWQPDARAQGKGKGGGGNIACTIDSVTPVAFGAPLMAGLMADALGFRAVFAVAALGSLAGLALLLGRVHEPRWPARP